MDTIRKALTPQALAAITSEILGDEQGKTRRAIERSEDPAGNRKSRRRARALLRRDRRRAERVRESV